RYADIMLDRTRARLVCVVEDHRGSAVANELRTVAIGGGEPATLIAGNDFYAAPRLSPDASQLAWLTWNHPNMPWDGNELWLAEVDTAGELHNARLVAGGPRESILQPSWSAGGVLHFCSDRTGWWILYRIDDPDTITALAPMDADCGRPQWAFGQ